MVGQVTLTVQSDAESVNLTATAAEVRNVVVLQDSSLALARDTRHHRASRERAREEHRATVIAQLTAGWRQCPAIHSDISVWTYPLQHVGR